MKLTADKPQLDLYPYAKIHWLEDVKAVRVELFDLFMSLDDFINVMNHVLEFIKEYKSEIWIADSYNSEGVFSKEIQEYISNELIATGVSIGVKKVLTVMPKSYGLANMTTKNWQARVRKANAFVMEEFPDIETCKRWISS
ncbi:MAG: hypothetical protein AAGA66_15770 [Bacteroidota bacterium]